MNMLSTSQYFFSSLFLLFTPLLAQSSEFSKPWFEEEPVDSLNVITKSAIIRCKIVNALNAWWECSEDERFIEKRNTPNMYVDPRTGVRHIELQLEVKRRHNTPSTPEDGQHSSMSSIGKTHNFECWCNAYGGHQTVSSRRASLQFSKLAEPWFVEEPVDSLVTKSAIVKCKVVNAIRAWWECSGDERYIEKKNTPTMYVDPLTEVRHIELQLEVKRRHNPPPNPDNGQTSMSSNVKTPNIECWCNAYGGHETVSSRRASLQFSNTYQQQNKREKKEKEKDSSLRSGRNEQEIYLLSIIAATFFIMFLVFVIMIFRRKKNKHQDISYGAEENGRQDGHSIHLLLPQQQNQQNQSPPDLIRGDKMQLISRLNNFNGNVLEHLVIRNEHLHPNPNNSSLIPVQTVNPTLNNNHPVNHSSSSSSPTSSVALAQQRRGQQLRGPGSVSGASSAGEESSEPDYAEPILTSPVTFTPEKRPPLPKSSPPFNNSTNSPHRGSQPSTPTRVKPLMNRPPRVKR